MNQGCKFEYEMVVQIRSFRDTSIVVSQMHAPKLRRLRDTDFPLRCYQLYHSVQMKPGIDTNSDITDNSQAFS